MPCLLLDIYAEDESASAKAVRGGSRKLMEESLRILSDGLSFAFSSAIWFLMSGGLIHESTAQLVINYFVLMLLQVG